MEQEKWSFLNDLFLVWMFLKIFKIKPPGDWTILSLGTHPKEMKAVCGAGNCTQASWSTRHKVEDGNKLFVNRWIEKMWYILHYNYKQILLFWKKKQSNCLSWENCMELKVIMSSEISQVQQDHPWFYWSVESEIGERGVVIARGWGYLCGQQMEQVNQGPPGYSYLGARNSGVPFHSRVILINNIILCISKSRRKKMNAFTIMKQ